MKRYQITGIISIVLMSFIHASQAATIQTAPALRKTVANERLFDGLVEAVNKSTVSSQVMGRVIKINYDVDDFVPKDAVILQFRGSEQKARSSQAEAALREAQARRQEAEDEHQRISDIYEKKLISKAALDKAEASLKAARAKLDASEAALDEARIQAGYTVVKAPFSGYVTQRHVEVGESVSIGQPLMTGVSLEALRVTATIPQSLVNDVRQHATAIVVMPDGSRVKSNTIRVFPFADEQAHTFKVRVNLPQNGQQLYPGMFIKIALITGNISRLLVPTDAVVHRSELTAVYVVKPEGGISLRQIRTGWKDNDSIEVLAGLDEGEQVAVDPIAAGIALKQQR